MNYLPPQTGNANSTQHIARERVTSLITKLTRTRDHQKPTQATDCTGGVQYAYPHFSEHGQYSTSLKKVITTCRLLQIADFSGDIRREYTANS